MIHEDNTFHSATIGDLKEVAQQIKECLDTVKIWLFHGEMGSGKTTLIKEICKAKGVSDAMSSPTFSIVHEYQTSELSKIYHFDFYRIKNESEAVEIGTEDYFYSGYPCFIEWPEKIPSLIPLPYADVIIQVETNTTRTIAIAIHDGKKENGI